MAAHGREEKGKINVVRGRGGDIISISSDFGKIFQAASAFEWVLNWLSLSLSLSRSLPRLCGAGCFLFPTFSNSTGRHQPLFRKPLKFPRPTTPKSR